MAIPRVQQLEDPQSALS